jgi:hypothetical protein
MTVEDMVNGLNDEAFECLLLSCIQRANRENRLSWAAVKVLIELLNRMSTTNVNEGIKQTGQLIDQLKTAALKWVAGKI